ncbi:MAG TPA: hypothetical protein VK281_15025 [Xanthobacteraceae bacterium]|nr:hypothetical protein [Xanthobacteraceae bacterium]
MQAQSLPNLEGLDRLAFREGVDIRPTLVRVLTDLYVQKPSHTAEEERHYTELVLRLIDTVDISTRAIVARKLATYEAAPAPIVRRLARDAIEVAEPVLKYSQRLTGQELIAVIQDLGPRYAEAIAARRAPEPVPIRRPEPARTIAPLATTAGGDAGPSADEAARATADLVAAATARGDAAPSADEPAPSATPDIRLGEAFFAATSAERRAMLDNLDQEIAGSARREQDRAHEACALLEAAALQCRPEDFTEHLEHALGVTLADAWRIVADDDGEPLLVAAKVLAMPSPVLLRILLFLNPAIGQSVQRVFYLTQLYERLAPAAALRIVASLRDAAPVTRRAGHRPILWDDDADRGRRAAAESARRPAGHSTAARRDSAAPPRVPAEWTPVGRPKAR